LTLSAKALCTLALVETELGISAGSDTLRIERLIEAASAEIAKYCGAPSFHYESARIDDLKGYGYPAIFTPKRPLLSIGSIVYDPQDAAEIIDSSEYQIDNVNQGRIYRAGGWTWSVARGQYMTSFPLPGTEESMYRVTYAGGYRTRNQVTGTLNGALTSGTVTAVVINETIPTDTPDTGAIKILLDSGAWLDVDYTSWDTKTFTIASTDFSSAGAADENAVEVTVNLTLPEDLEDAAIMFTAMRYKWGPRNPSIVSEKLDSWAASYASSKIIAVGMPIEVASKIEAYVRPVFA
jgi:hypothetical protein